VTIGPELTADIAAFVSVVVIDVVLAGDNALVVGLAASRLRSADRKRVVALGIGVALLCRIGFALVAVELLQITGLLLAGGLLLLWVAWKLWREIEEQRKGGRGQSSGSKPPAKTMASAVWQIVIADVSMSLDNVLGVAGAAHDHPWMLVFGLVLSVGLMGIAATLIAGFMQRHHWLGYLGLAVITYVALAMIFRGMAEVAPMTGF
jgi:YjbE family integral membrane protein